MSSVRRLTAVPSDPAALRRPVSPPRGFEPRGFDRGVNRGRGADAARRVTVAAVITPHQARGFWAGLMARRCGSREEAAVVFGVTFQTACNWFDGFSTPTGDKVLMAVAMWPEEFGLDAGETARAA
jgi:hypothetical protein